ncbi:TPA: hypothetical protein ACL3UQ_002014, partial [Streptococcus pneumoniae]
MLKLQPASGLSCRGFLADLLILLESMSVISLSISKKLEKSECLRYHFHIERKRGITDGYYLTRTSICIRRFGTIHR